MPFKSINRFFVFGVALMATLYFFGVRADQYISKSSQTGAALSENSISFKHSGPMQQPVEIENKEEQPESEDDELKESSSGTPGYRLDLCSLLTGEFVGHDGVVFSKIRTEYRTPAYIRLRSIII